MFLDFWCENRGGSLTSYSPVDVHLAQASAFSHILYLLTMRWRLIMNFVCHLLVTSCRNTRGSNCITSVIKDIDHTMDSSQISHEKIKPAAQYIIPDVPLCIPAVCLISTDPKSSGK